MYFPGSKEGKQENAGPICSAISFVFPLAFVLLNSPVYILLFAYPPIGADYYADIKTVTILKSVSDFLNLSYFVVNLPLFIWAIPLAYSRSDK